MGQLYGEFDEQTHEWTDGILSNLVREGTSDLSSDMKWYVFDGPVDAVWIESMNTVLDDNKKLCLSSGEIIKLIPTQKMIFEVDHLAYASPATVSRCGMVFLEPKGIEPLLVSWSSSKHLLFPPESGKMFQSSLATYFDLFFHPSLKFIRSSIQEMIATSNTGLTQSFIAILDSLISIHLLQYPVISDPKCLMLQRNLDSYVIFSIIWSLGCSCEFEGRVKFDEFLRSLLQHSPLKAPVPLQGLVYDFRFDIETHNWIPWSASLAAVADLPASFDADLIIPTVDTIRYTFLLNLLVTNKHHVLCVGPTGTGKTVVIKELLTRGLDKHFIPLTINFSARTNSNNVQDFLDSKMEKRRKGVFGPPLGSNMLIFIDDMNMPAVESTGAQPSIELLRQWMDHHGWYDLRNPGKFMEIVDLTFVGAVGPPGGGRNPISPRLTRHFNILSFVEMEHPSMVRIFSTILTTFFAKLSSKSADLALKMTEASIKLYSTIRSELLPTPLKSHYTFNLRDLSKVIRGLTSSDTKTLSSDMDVVRLWCHECLRVFHDRLVDNVDCTWFKDLLAKILGKRVLFDLLKLSG